MKFTILHIITAVVLSSCSSQKKPVTYASDPAINLQQILQEEVGSGPDSSVGISLTVISPELGIDFSGAAGFDSLKRDTLLDAAQPFRIASLTKVFVAAAIVRLREKGQLSLEDPISKYISPEHIKILEEGGYQPDDITIRHCLTHTSGLYDYAEGGPEYIEIASRTPARRWTRTEQLQFAMKYGKPHALPGKENHYSDTGYILLGETIETIRETGLAEGLRSLLKFEEVGMAATWLESLEPRPTGLQPSVRRYMGIIDASDWDNSVDLYGGGGLASTTRDLAVFLQALFNGQIFDHEESLAIMLLQKEYNAKGKDLPEQRLGFGSLRGSKNDIVAYTHSGFWGTFFIHFPKYNCSIAVNDTNDGNGQVTQRVVDYILHLGNELEFK